MKAEGKTGLRCRMAPNTVVQWFDRGALVLCSHPYRLLELDERQAWALRSVQQAMALEEMANEYAIIHKISLKTALDAVINICVGLVRMDILQQIGVGRLPGEKMNTPCYVQNPDVNIREEDEDGALLYNPDTNRVQLVNTTGMFIWQKCKQPQTLEALINAFREEFDEVPEEVAADVDAYLKQMLEAGFIGITEEA